MPAALDLLLRRRRWLLFAAGAGFSGYGAYKIYHLPSVARKRRKLARLANALLALAEAAAASADTLTLVSSDLNRFLTSDSDELPASLKQLSKIAASDEFSTSLSSLSEAFTAGIIRGYRAASPGDNDSGFSDGLLDKLFSPAGSGFASVVVGSFAREFVLAFYSMESPGGSSQESEPRWIRLICDDKCRILIGDCIQRFVSTAVTVFLDRTMDINTYDEIFSGLTNPKHAPDVRDLLVSVCKGAVETLVKTSHQVMTSSSSGGASELSVDSEPGKSKEGGGWADRVSSTLAVPGNRKFILDVTGRVTFETVRSFLEFLLWKMCDSARRSVGAIREEVVDRGLEVMRYISARSMIIATVCFSLCMNLARTKVLMPA